MTYKLEQEIDISTVGARLKYARINKELTIKELAEMVNMSENTLGRWEKNLGEIENHPDKIKNICKILEVSPEYIFDGLDNNSFVWQRLSNIRS